MNITPNQIKAIEYHLWQDRGDTPDDQWVSFDEWLKIKKNMDKITASDVIGAFKGGNKHIAIAQLKHLVATL